MKRNYTLKYDKKNPVNEEEFLELPMRTGEEDFMKKYKPYTCKKWDEQDLENEYNNDYSIVHNYEGGEPEKLSNEEVFATFTDETEISKNASFV